ncbi:18340_t:CDS:2 [Rhizophagus irregularis]|nr:18340_t:CDS:2 [Rhizophagus irregularis]
MEPIHQNDITITDGNPNPNLENSGLESYEKLLNEHEKLKKQLEEQINIIQELERKNTVLKDEASKYQSALGAATNLQLSDSDTNNPVALKNDMLKLQDLLEDYITTCKGNVEININEIQKLLKRYKSNSVITKDQKDQKPLIKAVLQRHVIEEIFDYGEKYFNFDNLQNYKEYGCGAETYLYNRIYDLIQLAEVIAEKRDGVDDITRVLPIKLRQEVFAALGNRGFNKVIANKKGTFPHEFISRYQDILNREINKYRKLKDPGKKQEIEDMAGEIIRKVITLFWFRLEVQEPIAEYIWFDYNDNINHSYMEGTWEDDEIENIVNLS